jgi:hypothetical protein
MRREARTAVLPSEWAVRCARSLAKILLASALDAVQSQCGGSDIRYRRSASSRNEYRILRHAGI